MLSSFFSSKINICLKGNIHWKFSMSVLNFVKKNIIQCYAKITIYISIQQTKLYKYVYYTHAYAENV